ncbi:HAD-like protein [Serendipita vermifera]|nr:HAD-like protein [Serendipita vermifera]
MPQVEETFDAILFDMDGTLVDSTPGVEGAWETFATDYGLPNVTQIISQAHGVRTVENLKRFCGVTDPEELEREAQRFELEIVRSSKKDGKAGILILPNAKEVLIPLQAATPKEGQQVWAICTSATHAYANEALTATGLTRPTAFVAAEDVSKGKPDPEPYLIGARKCGVDASKCLVIEDAPNGIRSGKAAGAKVLAVLTSHSLESVKAAEPDWIVPDLTRVSFSVTDGVPKVSINID